jgi:hypothetical protein
MLVRDAGQSERRGLARTHITRSVHDAHHSIHRGFARLTEDRAQFIHPFVRAIEKKLAVFVITPYPLEDSGEKIERFGSRDLAQCAPRVGVALGY